MRLLYLLGASALLLALVGCAAPPSVPYSPAPRAQLDPLPADLKPTAEERSLCQTLLQRFSAPPQALLDLCESSTNPTPVTSAAE